MRFATSIAVLASLSNLTAAIFWVTPNADTHESVLFRGTNDENSKVPGDNPLEYCYEDRAADILQLEYVDIDPNPPSAGANVTINGAGTTSEDIEEGAYVKVQVKFGLVTILKTTADFCEQVKNAGLECPIEKGKLIVQKKLSIPDEVPNGKWTVTADVFTKDDKRITCVTTSVVFKSPEEKLKDL